MSKLNPLHSSSRLLLGLLFGFFGVGCIAVLSLAMAVTIMNLQATVWGNQQLVVVGQSGAPRPAVPPGVAACVSRVQTETPVGGLGVGDVPRFPGARRINYHDAGVSQYTVKSSREEIFNYYAAALAARCWEVAAMNPQTGLWRKGDQTLHIAVAERPASVALVDYRLARGVVLGYTTATHEDVCAAGSTMCVGYGCQPTGSPCPPTASPTPSPTSSPYPTPTATPPTCSGPYTPDGGTFCNYSLCGTGCTYDGATGCPNGCSSSTTCFGSGQFYCLSTSSCTAWGVACSGGPSGGGCGWGGAWCSAESTCKAPSLPCVSPSPTPTPTPVPSPAPTPVVCSGEYQVQGPSYSYCNWARCPNGCNFDANGCAVSCREPTPGQSPSPTPGPSPAPTPSICASGSFWCSPKSSCLPNGSSCSTSSDSCLSGYFWCSSSYTCVLNGNSCGSTTGCPNGYTWCGSTNVCMPSGSPCSSQETACPSDKYWCNGSCVMMNTPCSSRSGSPTCRSDEWLCNNVCVKQGQSCNSVPYYWPGGLPCGNNTSFCSSTNSCLANSQSCPSSGTRVEVKCEAGTYWCSSRSACVSTAAPCVWVSPSPVATPYPIRPSTNDAVFLRGDANTSGTVDISDVITITNFIHQGGGLSCLDAADVNDDGVISDGDAAHLKAFLFLGTSGPPAHPYPQRGQDPTPDSLSCGELVTLRPSPSGTPYLGGSPVVYVSPSRQVGPIQSDQERDRRQAQQLKDAQRNAQEMKRMVRRMRGEVDRMLRKLKPCGLVLPDAFVSAVKAFEAAIPKIEAAPSFDAVEEIMRTVWEAGPEMEEVAQNMPRYFQLCEFTKDAKRRIRVLLEVPFAQAKRRADRSQVEAIIALAKAAEEKIVKLRALVDQVVRLVTTDVEEAMAEFESAQDLFEDAQFALRTIQAALDVRRGVTQAQADVRTQERLLARLERQGLDVSLAQELLQLYRDQIAAVQQAIKDQVSAEELVAEVEQLYAIREELGDLRDALTGSGEFSPTYSTREKPIEFELRGGFRRLEEL